MQSEAPMKLDRLKHSSASQASLNHTSDRPAFPVARPVVRTGDDILRNRIQTMARFCSGKLLDDRDAGLTLAAISLVSAGISDCWLIEKRMIASLCKIKR